MKNLKTFKFWKHSKPDNADVLSQFYIGTMFYRYRRKYQWYPINTLEDPGFYSSLRVLKYHLVGRFWMVELALTMLNLVYVQVASICKSTKTYSTMSNELTAFNAGSKFVETLLSLVRRVDLIWPPFDSLSEGHQKIFKNIKTCFSKRNDKLTKYRCFALDYYCNMDVANTIHLWGRTQIRWTDSWSGLIG